MRTLLTTRHLDDFDRAEEERMNMIKTIKTLRGIIREHNLDASELEPGFTCGCSTVCVPISAAIEDLETGARTPRHLDTFDRPGERREERELLVNLYRALKRVTETLEQYADDHATEWPTDPTVELEQCRAILIRAQLRPPLGGWGSDRSG